MRHTSRVLEGQNEIVLTTTRLLLRTFAENDLPQYAELNADPRVVRWLGGVPLSREASDEIAEYANGLYATQGIGLLAIERREDAAFLGMCGLHHLDSFPDDIEIAWRLAYAQWGNGYATEAATAWLDHAFGELALPRVISIAEPHNVRSIAVMQRLGMSFEREADVEEDDQVFRAVVYAVTPGEWWNARRT